MIRAVLAAAVGVLLVGCDSKASGPTPTASATVVAPATPGVDIVAAPAEGEVTAWVRAELARGAADGRQVLIYVGATWCEPCMRFHAAAEAGDLDEVFPNLRLLEFDLDRDGARLQAAGCSSQYIPLFARPTAEGRCRPDDWIMGGVKGDQAVAQLRPRLESLLTKPRP